jgi:protein-S-isoprenylcysteine O-methyltransferase Ste14
MTQVQVFRCFFVAIFVGMVSISVYYRARARRSGESIPRLREGKLVLLARLLFAAPLYLPIVLYMIHPGWMDWAALPLPAVLRWVGVAVGLATLPLLYWVFSSIGSNISETALTKERHRLVTAGPYKWVRHPLYAAATLSLVSLSLVAANWFMFGIACFALLGIAVQIIPREEEQLGVKFGLEYAEYMQRTGRLAPRLFRARRP